MKWPFLIDQWGLGRAFECKAADCGLEVKLYLRAKVGFCNCTTGVADDEEIERVADLNLFGTTVAGRACHGAPVAVGWMKGRSRPFRGRSAEISRRACATTIARLQQVRRDRRDRGCESARCPPDIERRRG